MAIFKPKQILNRYTDLDIQNLKDRGFKTVFIDIDNTIAYPDSGEFTDEAKQFTKNIKKAGMKPIIVSNNTRKRVKNFVGDEDIDYVYMAMKPIPVAFWISCIKNKVKPSKCVAMGDQIMTDMVAANLSGCYGIYCKKLHDTDTALTSINRVFEKIIWRIGNYDKM